MQDPLVPVGNLAVTHKTCEYGIRFQWKQNLFFNMFKISYYFNNYFTFTNSRWGETSCAWANFLAVPYIDNIYVPFFTNASYPSSSATVLKKSDRDVLVFVLVCEIWGCLLWPIYTIVVPTNGGHECIC